MSKIFVSYRRSDAGGHAQALLQALEQRVGADHVFMDVDDIPPGDDFTQVLRDVLDKCEVLLAVVGPDWLEARTEPGGERRLDNPADYVRQEIATGLARKIRVIPVLVGGASMPKAKDLPDDLKAFARCNGVTIRQARFQDDVDHLLKSIPARWRLGLNFKGSWSLISSVLAGVITAAVLGAHSYLSRDFGGLSPVVLLLNIGIAALFAGLVFLFFRFRGMAGRAVLLLAGTAVAFAAWYANERVIFGAVSAIDVPTVVVLTPGRPNSRETSDVVQDAMASMPKAISTDDVSFEIQAIPYYGTPRYLVNRLQKNLLVRGYVVVSEVADGLRVRPVLPTRAFWSDVGAQTVDETSTSPLQWHRRTVFGRIYVELGIEQEHRPYSFDLAGMLVGGYGTKKIPVMLIGEYAPYQAHKAKVSDDFRILLYSVIHYLGADALRSSGRADLGCQVLDVAATRSYSEAVLYERFRPLFDSRFECLANDTQALAELLDALSEEGFSDIDEVRATFAARLIQFEAALPAGLGEANRLSSPLVLASHFLNQCPLEPNPGRQQPYRSLDCLIDTASTHADQMRRNPVPRDAVLDLIAANYMWRAGRPAPISQGFLSSIGVSIADLCDSFSSEYSGLQENKGPYYASARYAAMCAELGDEVVFAQAVYDFDENGEYFVEMLDWIETVMASTEPASPFLRRVQLKDIESPILRSILERLSPDWQDNLLVALATPGEVTAAELGEFVSEAKRMWDSLDFDKEPLAIKQLRQLEEYSPATLTQWLQKQVSQAPFESDNLEEAWKIAFELVPAVFSDDDISEDSEYRSLRARASRFATRAHAEVRDPLLKLIILGLLANEEQPESIDSLEAALWALATAYPEQWQILPTLGAAIDEDDQAGNTRLANLLKATDGPEASRLGRLHLLAETYENLGDVKSARNLYRTLLDSAEDLLRQDYYRMTVAQLDDSTDEACFTADDSSVTVPQLEALDALLAALGQPLPFEVIVSAELLWQASLYDEHQELTDYADWDETIEELWQKMQEIMSAAEDPAHSDDAFVMGVSQAVDKTTSTVPGTVFRALRNFAFSESLTDEAKTDSDDAVAARAKLKVLWRDTNVAVSSGCSDRIPDWLAEWRT